MKLPTEKTASKPSVYFDINSDAVLVRYRVRGGYLNRWLVRQEETIPGLVYRRYGIALLAVHAVKNPLRGMV